MNSGINPENTAVWRKNEVDMPTTSFKGYNIVEFSFANKLPTGAQIQLENKYQFNVKYASNKTCVGEMSIRVADRSNAESFFVSLLLRGVFTFTPGTAKEEIHIETYKIIDFTLYSITTIGWKFIAESLKRKSGTRHLNY